MAARLNVALRRAILRSMGAAVLLAGASSKLTVVRAQAVPPPDLASRKLHELDEGMKLELLAVACVYPRTVSMQEEARVVVASDGTKEGFKEAVAKVLRDPELLALGIQLSAADILQCMAANYEDLSLGVLDAVIIQRVGSHVIRINNTSQPQHGRVGLLDFNEVRLRAASAADRAKLTLVDKGFEFAGRYQVASNVIVSALVSGAVTLVTRRRAK